MTENERLTERARLFVAITLPPQVRDELVQWRSAALPRTRGLRLIDARDLHVTLCFLGWRSVHEVEAISRACEVLAGSSLDELSVGGAVWLPPRRPRVLAVELRDPQGALAEAQGRLSATLHRGGWYTPEKRPFLAHVTVARVRKGARAPVGELPPPPDLSVNAPAVTLYRSRLTPSGARYEPLTTVVPDSAAQ